MIYIIITHMRPHLDEIVAIWLLKKFGEKLFPGISRAIVACADEQLIGASPEEYEKRGILFVGMLGGRFDEHASVARPRIEKHCATTLVAEALGISDDPCLQKIIKAVMNNDLNAAAQPFDLAYICKIMNSQYPDNPEIVIDWVTAGLEAKYYEQAEFFRGAKTEFEDIARIEEVIGRAGKVLRVAIMASDNEQMVKFAFSEYGGDIAVIVKKMSSGNVTIHTNGRYHVDLRDVVRIIRLEEQRAEESVVTDDWSTLEQEVCPGAEKWYFHPRGSMLLNGSLSRPQEPTKLSLEQIARLVRLGLDQNDFPPAFSAQCRCGVCFSNRRNNCPYFHFGLIRCRKIRAQAKRGR